MNPDVNRNPEPDPEPDPDLGIDATTEMEPSLEVDPGPEMEPSLEIETYAETVPGPGADKDPDMEPDLGRSRTTEEGQHALNILLVEDDTVDVMNVQRAFQKSNILNPLYVAENGVEALEMLRSGGVPFRSLLILLDLNMPKMNGIEFLRELRADEELSHLPVVVLTTSNDERDRIEAYNLNVAGYVVKPVTFQSFVEVMATLNKYWTLVEMP